MFLSALCFYYNYLSPIRPMGNEHHDEQALMVVFGCALNAVILATFIWWADWPKELMGISVNENFWPIFKVFGTIAGVWTLLGAVASPIYSERQKHKRTSTDKRTGENFRKLFEECAKRADEHDQNLK